MTFFAIVSISIAVISFFEKLRYFRFKKPPSRSTTASIDPSPMEKKVGYLRDILKMFI